MQKYVELIASMGDDLTVVNAARVSFKKHTDVLRDKDIRLIKYLARNGHWTPFAHCMFTFRFKMPIFVARQWFRHTVGFVRNEVSRRYVDDPPEFFVPVSWRARADNVKQGSGGYVGMAAQKGAEEVRQEVEQVTANAYERLLKLGIAPEQARMVLPLSMYTEFYETASLAAYARLCRQRLASDAQAEVRVYAEAVADILQWKCPHSWKALMGVESV